jgi:hypothetical protein
VVRGGRGLLRKRANLEAARLTEAGWKEQWEAARLFLTADGEDGKPWGNETIRFNPDEGWLEIKLPAPLSHLANRPFGRYRLSCPVAFSYPGGTRSPRKPPPARSATTSRSMPHPGAGTWTRRGEPSRRPRRPWAS